MDGPTTFPVTQREAGRRSGLPPAHGLASSPLAGPSIRWHGAMTGRFGQIEGV